MDGKTVDELKGLADKGVADAANELGTRFWHGNRGAAHSEPKAFTWWLRAAQLGSRAAMVCRYMSV